MYLAIDIGNTLQKAGIYSKRGDLVHLTKTPRLDVLFMEELFKKYPIEHAIVSNVGAPNTELLNLLHYKTRCIIFDHNTPLPIQIKYNTPHTLGLDRIASAVAANALYPNNNCLVIQAGSCLVMDFVNKEQQYLGGSIAPGIKMRLTALHQHTHNLPEIDIQQIESFIGKDTKESILSGVLFGVTHEIEGAIQLYQDKFGEINVILTGGDAELLQEKIKKSIFAVQNLVLYGLYKILIFNV